MKLNSFLIKKLRKEFPFLEKMDLRSGDDLHIKKADNELLSGMTYQNRSWNGSMGEDHNIYEIFSVVGDKIVDISHCVGEYSGSNYAYSQKIDKKGSPLFESVPPGTDYIVIRQDYYSDWQGSQLEEEIAFTIYKKVDSQKMSLQAEKEAEEILKAEMTNLL